MARASGRDFVTGFTVGFSNPQPFAFYLSVMPAIISSTQVWPLMGIVSIGFAVVAGAYILATIPLQTWLKSSTNQRAVNRTLGLVFALIAIWIAVL
jgi:threonine/homoserine/homoserine lactone efflux protein